MWMLLQTFLFGLHTNEDIQGLPFILGRKTFSYRVRLQEHDIEVAMAYYKNISNLRMVMNDQQILSFIQYLLCK